MHYVYRSAVHVCRLLNHPTPAANLSTGLNGFYFDLRSGPLVIVNQLLRCAMKVIKRIPTVAFCNRSYLSQYAPTIAQRQQLRQDCLAHRL